MNRLIKTLALAIIASTLLSMSFACNTTEGLGKDTKAAGQGIEDAANNNK